MTVQMWLALFVLVAMILMMMSDKFAFGAPSLIAVVMLVVLGLMDVKEAFSGFINPTVIMIAGFMVVMAGLMKTSLVAKLEEKLYSLGERGGYKSYVLLLLLVMLGASIMGTGSTGYYVMLIPLVASLPYNKLLPASKLVMPLGFATNHPLIPINVALQFGVLTGVLESVGLSDSPSMAKLGLLNFCVSLGFLLWALVGYRVLPDHEIIAEQDEVSESISDNKVVLNNRQENITIVSFLVSVVGMMCVNLIGDVAYVIPLLCGLVLMLSGVINFDELRDNIVHPIVILTGGVIVVADALGNTGFSTMVGDFVANNLAHSLSPILLVFIFVLLTSAVATLTGSTIGTIYIFAPIAVATFQSLGLNPVGVASAVVLAGWNGHFLPLDGLPAMVYGAGKYSIKEFWSFSLPMYVIRLLFLTIGTKLIFY